jgi:hypothetical protein
MPATAGHRVDSRFLVSRFLARRNRRKGDLQSRRFSATHGGQSAFASPA